MSFRAEAAERPQSRNRDRPARGEVILSERLCENSDSNAIPEKPSLIHRAGATISIGGMILVSPFSPSVRVFTQSLAQDDTHSTGHRAIPRLRAFGAALGMTAALATPLAAQKPDRDYTVLVASEAVDLITRVRFGPGAG